MRKGKKLMSWKIKRENKVRGTHPTLDPRSEVTSFQNSRLIGYFDYPVNPEILLILIQTIKGMGICLSKCH
jgi:hypothetical protein